VPKSRKKKIPILFRVFFVGMIFGIFSARSHCCVNRVCVSSLVRSRTNKDQTNRELSKQCYRFLFNFLENFSMSETLSLKDYAKVSNFCRLIQHSPDLGATQDSQFTSQLLNIYLMFCEMLIKYRSRYSSQCFWQIFFSPLLTICAKQATKKKTAPNFVYGP